MRALTFLLGTDRHVTFFIASCGEQLCSLPNSNFGSTDGLKTRAVVLEVNPSVGWQSMSWKPAPERRKAPLLS